MNEVSLTLDCWNCLEVVRCWWWEVKTKVDRLNYLIYGRGCCGTYTRFQYHDQLGRSNGSEVRALGEFLVIWGCKTTKSTYTECGPVCNACEEKRWWGFICYHRLRQSSVGNPVIASHLDRDHYPHPTGSAACWREQVDRCAMSLDGAMTVSNAAWSQLA